MIIGQGDRRPHRGADIISAAPPWHVALLQLGLYLIVGGICFFIDVRGFVVLRLCGLPILTASALSFVTATRVNYLLCCGFVFRRGASRAQKRSSDFSLLLSSALGSIPRWCCFWPRSCCSIRRSPKYGRLSRVRMEPPRPTRSGVRR